MVKSVKVFFSQDEADALGLEIDHTDDLAISGADDFALLIHGSQPAGSAASKALSANKKKGFTGIHRNRIMTSAWNICGWWSGCYLGVILWINAQQPRE